MNTLAELSLDEKHMRGALILTIRLSMAHKAGRPGRRHFPTSGKGWGGCPGNLKNLPIYSFAHSVTLLFIHSTNK